MTDFRKLCQDLLDELQYQTNWSTLIRAEDLQERAHAALAEPEPERLTVQEISNLPQHWDDYIAEDRDGRISLDGYFSRADLQQLADSIPNTHD